MKLIRNTKATDGVHKYEATFQTDSGRTKTTKYGALGMDDYTKTHDTEQRERYRGRHKKDLATGDPSRAGFLSYHVLWGPSTSVHANLAAYRARYHL
jgi:Family of unknown function (DUF5754)